MGKQDEESVPFIRKRKLHKAEDRFVDSDTSLSSVPSDLDEKDLQELKSYCGPYPPELVFSGKVYLARKKVPDSFWCWLLELCAVVAVITFAVYSYFYLDNVVFHVTNGYAHLGHTEAKHKTGQRYLEGSGVVQNHTNAMYWFRKASDDGHPEASYNLALGHIKGHVKLEKGHAHRLMHHAAAKGVKEAHKILNEGSFCCSIDVAIDEYILKDLHSRPYRDNEVEDLCAPAKQQLSKNF